MRKYRHYLNYSKNLNKGYSLILNNKKLIKNKNELKKVNKFTVRFKDGDLEIDKV